MRPFIDQLEPPRPAFATRYPNGTRHPTAGRRSLRLPGNKNADVPWHSVRPAVLHYGDYVKDQTYIDSVFRRFDADLSGALERTELHALLVAVAPDEISVDEADVTFILEHFDRDDEGVISRDELLPMLAKWSQVAFHKIEAASLPSRSGWTQLKQSVAPALDGVGDALGGAGGRLLSIAQLARQQAQRKQAVVSRWRTAEGRVAESLHTDDGSGSSMMKVVVAARQQQSEECAQRRQPEEAAYANGGAASDDAGRSLGPEVSTVPALRTPIPVYDAPADVELSAGTLRQAMEKTHSRSSAFSLGDHDRPWEPQDHIHARSHKRDATRRALVASRTASTRNALTVASMGSTGEVPPAAPGAQPRRPGADANARIVRDADSGPTAGSSSLCVLL